MWAARCEAAARGEDPRPAKRWLSASHVNLTLRCLRFQGSFLVVPAALWSIEASRDSLLRMQVDPVVTASAQRQPERGVELEVPRAASPMMHVQPRATWCSAFGAPLASQEGPLGRDVGFVGFHRLLNDTRDCHQSLSPGTGRSGAQTALMAEALGVGPLHKSGLAFHSAIGSVHSQPRTRSWNDWPAVLVASGDGDGDGRSLSPSPERLIGGRPLAHRRGRVSPRRFRASSAARRSCSWSRAISAARA